MSRSQKRWLADQGMVDGQIFIDFNQQDVYVGTGQTPVRAAAGNTYLSLPTAATAYTIDRDVIFTIFRTGMQDDLQEEFGGGATSQVFAAAQGLASPPATFTTPAGVSGPPPFTGVTQFTPVTSARPKGVKINAITAVYQVNSTNATVNNIALYQSNYVNGVAPAVSTILAPSNLTLTAASTPYVTKVSLASPAYLTTKNSALTLEWNVTTGATSGTVYLWGVILQCDFNYQ